MIKTKRQATEWGEIFAIDVINRGLIFKINSSRSAISKIKYQYQPNQKVGTKSQLTFLQMRQTDGQRHVKRYSALLVIR